MYSPPMMQPPLILPKTSKVGERKYNKIDTKETILLLQTALRSSQEMTEKKDKWYSLLQKTKFHNIGLWLWIKNWRQAEVF